jgi:tetratricopeptide (TPR) repeat protein
MQSQPKTWPVLSGTVPSLAEGYILRPETGQGPWEALQPGLTVILGPHTDRGAPKIHRDGTGKTQLAAEFARKLWSSAELDLLVWLDAVSRDSIITGYARALADIRVAAPAGRPEAAASLFLAWLADTGRRWLVVLDGLAAPGDAEGLWPEGPSGQALVTTSLARLIPVPARPRTATRTAASPAPKPLSIAVGSFSQREAIEYLTGRLNNDPYQASGSLDLAITMDLLPAGLALAAAYMLYSGHDCGRYRLDYEKYRRNQDGGIASDPLAPAWVLAIDRTRQVASADLAWPALKLAAVLGPAGIPGAVLTSSAACAYVTGRQATSRTARASAQAAFSDLQQLGLVTIDPDDEIRTLSMPAALQSSVRRIMSPAELRQAVQAGAEALYQSWPDAGFPENMEQTLRKCTISLSRCDGDLMLRDPGFHSLLVRAGRSLDDAKMAETALTWWHDLAARSAAHYGARSLPTFQLRERLVSAAAMTGHTDEAIRLRHDLAADIDETAGSEHPQAIACRAALARLFRTAGMLSDAISLGTQVTADSDLALGHDHPQTTQAMQDLGSAYCDAGRYPEAISVLERCLTLRTQTLGLMHEETLSARYQLAQAYRRAGKDHEALRLYHTALARAQKADGTGYPDMVTAREHLAIAYYLAGQTDNATVTLEQALTEWSRAPGADPRNTIAAQANLAAIYCQTGRLNQAIGLYRSLLTDLGHIRGPVHPQTLRTRSNLAAAYHKARQLPEAINLGEATLADCQQTLGNGHSQTLTTRANLAHVYHATGQLKRASAHFDRALRDCEQALGTDAPLTGEVRVLRNYYLSGHQGTAPIVTPPELLAALRCRPHAASPAVSPDRRPGRPAGRSHRRARRSCTSALTAPASRSRRTRRSTSSSPGRRRCRRSASSARGCRPTASWPISSA